MSPPWMPLYIADYLADTSRLSTLEHGAYLLLIMDYWRNGSLPADDRKLARIARLSVAEWEAVRDDLAELFLPGWRHKRIDAELARSSAKSDAARGSAAKRWGCKTDANASPSADANASPPHNPGISETTADPMLSQSQSLSEKELPPPSIMAAKKGGGDILDCIGRVLSTYPPSKSHSQAKALAEIEATPAADWAALIAGCAAYAADYRAKPTTHPIALDRFIRERIFANYAPSAAAGPPRVFVIAETEEWRERVAAGHKSSLRTATLIEGRRVEGWHFPARAS